MDTIERIPLIVKMSEITPNIGKTAVMKCIYLLQTIKKVPLGYHFEIYTYGPYSSVVMDEIDYARQCGLINVESLTYPTGQFGYQIKCNESGKETAAKSALVSKYNTEINEIMSEFGDKKASELELLSTIIFVATVYKLNGKKEIIDLVGKIKPKFETEYIDEKYEYLKEKDYV